MVLPFVESAVYVSHASGSGLVVPPFCSHLVFSFAVQVEA